MDQGAGGACVQSVEIGKIGGKGSFRRNEMPADQQAMSKPKLRWFQYSLRSLFILMFLVAIASSWVAVKMGQAKRQKEFVRQIRKIGGLVVYDYDGKSHYDLKSQEFQPPQPKWMIDLMGDDFFNNIVSVGVYPSNNKSGLDNIKDVSLPGTKITDVGLENLKELKQLQTLDLTDTAVTDVGLIHLKGLSHIKDLVLMGTKITNEGLKNLKGMEHLKKLDLRRTTITDACLDNLKDLRQLQRLDLGNTKVTDAGVAKLQKALPNCTIVH
jgi:hypothetical protein